MLSLPATGISAASKGDSGTIADILTAPPDARTAGMGGGSAALLDSHSQGYSNPAALGTLYDRDIQTGYGLLNNRAHFFNMNGLWARPQSGNVGAGITHVEYRDPRSRSSLAKAVGWEAQSASVVALTYGTPPDYNTFFSNIPLGVSFKFIRQAFTGVSGTGFAADVGAGLIVRSVPGLSFGGSLVNLGYVSGLSSGTGELPFSWRTGFAYKLSLDEVLFQPLFNTRLLQNPREDFRLAIDSAQTADGNMRLEGGGEIWIAETLALRGGIQLEFLGTGGTGSSGLATPVPTLGLGLGTGEPYNVRLDVGYIAGSRVGDDLRFTFIYVFDRFANSPEQIRLRRLRKDREEAQLEEEDQVDDDELFRETEE